MSKPIVSISTEQPDVVISINVGGNLPAGGTEGQVLTNKDGQAVWADPPAGGGVSGEDGGFYTPTVNENGDLSWIPSDADMPSVRTVNIKGEKGDQGETGLQGEPGQVGPKGDKGESGVHVGPDEPTDPNVNVWIDLDGEATVDAPYQQLVTDADGNVQWTEREFYKLPSAIIVPNDTYGIFSSYGMSVAGSFAIPVVGQYCHVIYGDIETDKIATNGNRGVRIGDDYNEFIIEIESETSMYVESSKTGRVVIEITQNAIKKIDADFLPDLPIATADTYGLIKTDGLVGRQGDVSSAEVFNDYAHNIATKEYAHAEGYYTQAKGKASHAEGDASRSLGWGAHAEGYNTCAEGNFSHSEGMYTEAQGSKSHAEGTHTKALSENQHVQGKSNIADSDGKYAHIVGNGVSDMQPSNAHTLDWNGVGWFAGGLKVGGTGQDDAAAIEVATKVDITQLSEEIYELRGELTATEQTVSGNVVTVKPVAGTEIKVVSKLTDVDTGYTYAGQLKLRKIRSNNLYDVVSLYGGEGTIVEKNGVTATFNGNGTVTLNGTATSAGTIASPKASDNAAEHVWVFPAGTYTVPPKVRISVFAVDALQTSLGYKTATFTVDQPFWIKTYDILNSSGDTFDNQVIPIGFFAGSSVPSSGYAFDGDVYRVTLGTKIANGVYDWQTGTLTDADGNVVKQLAAIGPFTASGEKVTFMTGVGETAITYTAPAGTTGNPGGGTTVNPDKYAMPILRIKGNTTGMNKDDAVTLDYEFGLLTGTCTCKWQGSSSLAYPKKNYTIKFDNAIELVEGWGAQKKYCAKANWIDFSHSRNVVNAKLWGQIVASRMPQNTTLAACPNYGAVDGYPICIYLNDEFMGVYTMNIPKDGWMMNMGSGTSEAILGAGKGCPITYFKEEATLTGEYDLEIEYITDENNAAWAKTSVNNLISACINSDGSDLDTTIAAMLDWESAIDYWIFVALIRGDDMVGKNYLLGTHDGTKWFFSAYDMDCTYGLYWDGSKWVNASEGTTFAHLAATHRVAELICTYKKDALKARYAELRASVLSEENVANAFLNFAGSIPRPMLDEDNRKWPTIPNTNVNNAMQIVNWYRLRVQKIDAEIETM